MRTKYPQPLLRGMQPTALGARCELLFNAGQQYRATVGTLTWSYGSTNLRPQANKYGMAVGPSSKADLSGQVNALNGNDFTIIAAVTCSNTNLNIVSQRAIGHGFTTSPAGFNLVQWGVRNNIVSGSAIAGDCILSVTKKSATSAINYYMNGNTYGSIAGTNVLSVGSITAAIGSQASSGANSATGINGAGTFIYGVAVLPYPDDQLCKAVTSVPDFFRMFWQTQATLTDGNSVSQLPLTYVGR